MPGDEEVITPPETVVRERTPKASQYESMYTHIQSLAAPDREKSLRTFGLVSLAEGMPVVVTQEGTVATPLDFWEQLKRETRYTSESPVTASDLRNLLLKIGVQSTALRPSPVQNFAQEVVEMERQLEQQGI